MLRTTAHPAAHSRACGAGDTFTAAYTAALCAELTPVAALAVAQAAADVVVGQEETAVCSTGALTAQLAAADRGGLLSHRDLLAVIEEHRHRGHRVVFTNGCFDVLHRGHVTYLRQARALGDLLVVALNSDDSVARLKGPERPVNPLADRAGVVGAIECVDLVTAFSEDTPGRPDRAGAPGGLRQGRRLHPGDAARDPDRRAAGRGGAGAGLPVRPLDHGDRHPDPRHAGRRGGPVTGSSRGEIDVLIPTRNRPVELATTLAGLAAQDHPFDVVISDQSDGAPSFDTPPAQTLLRVLRAAGHRVDAVVHPPRHGVAEHRAALLARSTARYALFLDDDIWLEPGTIARLHEAIAELGCGLVGAAMQGVSYLDDRRPAQLAPFERWEGRPAPERIAPDTPAWDRWMLHNAANPLHLAAGARAAVGAVGAVQDRVGGRLRALRPGDARRRRRVRLLARPAAGPLRRGRRGRAPGDGAVRRGGHPAVGGVPPGVADDGAGPRAQREQPAGGPGPRRRRNGRFGHAGSAAWWPCCTPDRSRATMLQPTGTPRGPVSGMTRPATSS